MYCTMQDHFRFYIFTMGDKTYAEAMATLLDPENRHFRARIVNRSDAVSSVSGRSSPGGRPGQPHLMVKTLQQVGISGKVAAVLDDTSGAPHLVTACMILNPHIVCSIFAIPITPFLLFPSSERDLSARHCPEECVSLDGTESARAFAQRCGRRMLAIFYACPATTGSRPPTTMARQCA